METNQSTSQPVTRVYSTPPGIFSGKVPSTVAFTIGILLFLLPFAEIRCSSTALTNKSGLDFALANEWKPVGGYGKEFLGKNQTKTESKKEGNSQLFALAGLGLAALGLLCCMGNPKLTGSAGTAFGVLSAGALIALMVELKSWFRGELARETAEKAKKTDVDSFGNLDGMNVNLGFTPWAYVTVAVLLAAAYFCYRRMTGNRNL